MTHKDAAYITLAGLASIVLVVVALLIVGHDLSMPDPAESHPSHVCRSGGGTGMRLYYCNPGDPNEVVNAR